MESTARPLSADELRTLARLGSSRDALNGDLLSTACAFMLVFGAGAGLVRWTLGPPQGAALGVVAGIAGMLALWMLVTVRRGSGRLALADGRVLFLSGQYLYEYEEDGVFPCRRFTLERAPESGLFLGLTPLGPPFQPSGTLPSFQTEDHRAGRVPEDCDVLTVDFESLRAKRAG